MLYPLLKLRSVAGDIGGLLRTVDREGFGKVNMAYVYTCTCLEILKAQNLVINTITNHIP
jgi:hypothetical protein